MTEFRVPDMTCGHCEASIRKQLSSLAGIDDVVIDRASKRVAVRGQASADTIRQAIEAAGFKADIAPRPGD